VDGEVEKDDGVLVIRRIHVTYHLTAPRDANEVVQRAFEVHPPSCPVYRTLSGSIEISMELDLTST
jgi:uncharacterized OsmC-like protein